MTRFLLWGAMAIVVGVTFIGAVVIAGPRVLDDASLDQVVAGKPDCDTPGLENKQCPDNPGQMCPVTFKYKFCQAQLQNFNDELCGPKDPQNSCDDGPLKRCTETHNDTLGAQACKEN